MASLKNHGYYHSIVFKSKGMSPDRLAGNTKILHHCIHQVQKQWSEKPRYGAKWSRYQNIDINNRNIIKNKLKRKTLKLTFNLSQNSTH